MSMTSLVLFLAPVQVSAAADAAPESGDVLGGRLEELRERIGIPGMSAAVVRDGAVVWSAGFGFADLEAEVFAEPATRYRIASVSKTLASVLVFQEVEAGRLSLDAPMRDFAVPRWFSSGPERYEAGAVQVRHVLSHTSEGEPGSAYRYDGNVFGDLTFVLESVTRRAYADLLQERVFGRAAMTDSVPGHLTVGGEVGRPIAMARPYRWDGEYHEVGTYQMIDPDPRMPLAGFEPVHAMPAAAVAHRKELLGDAFRHWSGCTSAGGVVSTVLDLARFDIALDAGKLVSEESRARMFTATRSTSGQVLPYGLGWFVEEIEGTKVVWHYGWLPPSVSALYVKVPERRTSFFVLANNDRLSASFSFSSGGVRASPFARAYLEWAGVTSQ